MVILKHVSSKRGSGGGGGGGNGNGGPGGSSGIAGNDHNGNSNGNGNGGSNCSNGNNCNNNNNSNGGGDLGISVEGSAGSYNSSKANPAISAVVSIVIIIAVVLYCIRRRRRKNMDTSGAASDHCRENSEAGPIQYLKIIKNKLLGKAARSTSSSTDEENGEVGGSSKSCASDLKDEEGNGCSSSALSMSDATSKSLKGAEIILEPPEISQNSTESEMRRLLSTISRVHYSTEDGKVCVICLDPFLNEVATVGDCKHPMHLLCLKTRIKTTQDETCPECGQLLFAPDHK